MDILSQTSDLEDEKLVKLSLVNPDQFLFIINRYKDRLTRYINHLGVVNKEDAEDILQDIFLKVYLNLNDFNTNLKFSSWIYRIAHNQVMTYFRKRKVRPEAYSSPINSPNLQLLIDEISLNVNSNINLNQELVAKALEKIKPCYREILILKFFEDKSYQEISDILKKPIGSVSSLLNRAKKSLKKYLPNTIE